ncbi:MAG: toll/interleukin-1 receptor domain-containing protein [Chitinophagaceae bacterium]
MQQLDQITVNRVGRSAAVIQLLQGSLTALPATHAADILVLSAYPGSYVPVPRSLIAALYDVNIDVAEMAKHKEIDLRDQLGCWLSAPLSDEKQAQLNFKRILCFEPHRTIAGCETLVGNIFRCINTFAFNENINVIALPVLASGRQKVPMEKMLPAILDAGIFWLESGLPLDAIKLVLYSDAQTEAALPVFLRARQQNELKQSIKNGQVSGADALKLFEMEKSRQAPGEAIMPIVCAEIKKMVEQAAEKAIAEAEVVLPPLHTEGQQEFPGKQVYPHLPGEPNLQEPATNRQPQEVPEGVSAIIPPATSATGYDCFVSYAHSHAAVINSFVKKLEQGNKQLNVFYDKTSIPPGGLWIKQISDAIQKSKKVLIFLSPDYSNSLVCWDEFQCAKLIEYNSKKQVIQTIYLYNDAAMPPIMGIYSWADCREADEAKLDKIVTQLIAEL